jgi:hypothetical protein
MPSYQKKKSKKIKGPNATGPKYRTSKSFRGKNFADKKHNTQIKFNPGQFKTQHKG